jgi:hypothetical protein
MSGKLADLVPVSVSETAEVTGIYDQVQAAMAAARQRIAAIAALRDGWHDGFGKATTAEAVAAAMDLLNTDPAMAPLYHVFPTDEGGLLFEFVLVGWNYAFEVGSAGAVEGYGTEMDGEGEWAMSAEDVGSDVFRESFDRIAAALPSTNRHPSRAED